MPRAMALALYWVMMAGAAALYIAALVVEVIYELLQVAKRRYQVAVDSVYEWTL
jgi:hypothetical protein